MPKLPKQPKLPKLPKTIIVGAGIAGLSSVISAALLGHDVLLIDNRKEYSRDQLIFLPELLITQLFNVTSLEQKGVMLKFVQGKMQLYYSEKFKREVPIDPDLEFFKLIEDRRSVIEIKTFQDYQLQKVQAILKKKKILFPKFLNPVISSQVESKVTKEVEELSVHGKVEIRMGPENEVIAIDAQKQEITLKPYKPGDQAEIIKFDYLVAADGANHSTATMLMDQNPEYAAALGAIELEPPAHNSYGVVRFQVDLSDKVLDEMEYMVITPHQKGSSTHAMPAMSAEGFESLKNLGWNEDFLPFVYIVFDPKRKECYVTGEVPNQLNEHPSNLSSQDKSRLLTIWFKMILLHLLEIEPKHLRVLKGNAFKVQTTGFNTNSAILGKGGLLILTGDAFIPANFLYGHGAIAAIGDGLSIYYAFKKALSQTTQPKQEALLLAEQYESFKMMLNSAFSAQIKLEFIQRIIARTLEYTFFKRAIEQTRQTLLAPTIPKKQKLIEKDVPPNPRDLDKALMSRATLQANYMSQLFEVIEKLEKMDEFVDQGMWTLKDKKIVQDYLNNKQFIKIAEFFYKKLDKATIAEQKSFKEGFNQAQAQTEAQAADLFFQMFQSTKQPIKNKKKEPELLTKRQKDLLNKPKSKR